MDKRTIEPGHITVLGTVVHPIEFWGVKYYSVQKICAILNVDFKLSVAYIEDQFPAAINDDIEPEHIAVVDYFNFIRWIFSYHPEKPTSERFFQFMNELYQVLSTKMESNESLNQQDNGK